MTRTIAPIKHHHFALFGNSDPNAIQLDHFGDLLQGIGMKLVDQRLELIDPLVDRSQPGSMADGRTPALTDVTQAVPSIRYSRRHLVLNPSKISSISPKSLLFLQNRRIIDHIMLATLTFQHRHLQV